MTHPGAIAWFDSKVTRKKERAELEQQRKGSVKKRRLAHIERKRLAKEENNVTRTT